MNAQTSSLSAHGEVMRAAIIKSAAVLPMNIPASPIDAWEVYSAAVREMTRLEHMPNCAAVARCEAAIAVNRSFSVWMDLMRPNADDTAILKAWAVAQDADRQSRQEGLTEDEQGEFEKACDAAEQIVMDTPSTTLVGATIQLWLAFSYSMGGHYKSDEWIREALKTGEYAPLFERQRELDCHQQMILQAIRCLQTIGGPSPSAIGARLRWAKLENAYFAAQAIEGAFDAAAWRPAYDIHQSGGAAVPDDIDAEMDRLMGVRYGTEQALMAEPAPDMTAFARKFLIAKAHDLDIDGWNVLLQADAERLLMAAGQPE